MAHFDKYDPYSGGFRGPLAFKIEKADVGKPIAVGVNANGQIIKGNGNANMLGVVIGHSPKNIGDIIDVMTHGEIVEMTGVTAGTRLYGFDDGSINATKTGTPLGFTIEKERFVVRVGQK